MVNESAIGFPVVERMLKGIQGEVAAHRRGDAPADDAACEDVDHEGHIHDASPGPSGTRVFPDLRSARSKMTPVGNDVGDLAPRIPCELLQEPRAELVLQIISAYVPTCLIE